jgi:hypothetical protein
MSKDSLPILMDAISEAYDNPELRQSADGSTHCNASVAYILSKFGITKYLPQSLAWVANSMIDDMRKDPYFKIVNGSRDAQRLANKGVLIIAGLKAEPHGHVAVLRPGVPEWSATWKCFAPKGMSVGSEAATFIAKKMSWAFRKEPQYFMLRQTDDA